MKLIAFIALCLLLAGCDRAHQAVTPGTASIEHSEVHKEPTRVTETREMPMPADKGGVWAGTQKITTVTDYGPVDEVKSTAKASGAGLTASGDKLTENFDGSPLTVGLDGIGGGSGGGVKSRGTIENKVGSAIVKAASSPLMWFGLGGIVVGVILFLIPLRRAAMIVGISGIGLVAASFIPAWAWIALAVIGLGIVGFYVYAEFAKKNGDGTLRTIVKSVENLPEEAAAAVKAKIAEHASGVGNGISARTIRTVIKKAKDAAGV